MKAAIVGASGYLGEELLRLLAGHPEIEVAAAQAQRAAGSDLASFYPWLAWAYDGLLLDEVDPNRLLGCDVVFIAVPSGASQELVSALVGKVGCVVDLGADFRLRAPGAYEQWYGFTHGTPDLLERATYGLPELFRAALPGAELIAAPGCYVTAASLSLAPLVAAGAIEKTGIIVDGASGTSGAGRSPSPAMHYATVNENFTAYGLLDHRHTPEIEQVIGAQVLFTPHLAPMTRGILTTSYGRAVGVDSTGELLALLGRAYQDEPFVTVSADIPTTRSTYGTNNARITARLDHRTGWAVVLCAIDNLTKGGAGQAIQAANIALGLEETSGLPRVAVMP